MIINRLIKQMEWVFLVVLYLLDVIFLKSLFYQKEKKNLLKVDFYNEPIEREKIIYVVITAIFKKQLVLVKHRERTTWEIPGGHRENHESAFNAVKRELFEETGALEFTLERVCAYSVTRDGFGTFGILYWANIEKFGPIPDFEIGETGFFDNLPQNLTYPEIQPILLMQVMKKGLFSQG